MTDEDAAILADFSVHVFDRDTIRFGGNVFRREFSCIDESVDGRFFVCSRCKCVAKVSMCDEYDCWVDGGRAMSFCPNCGAEVVHR